MDSTVPSVGDVLRQRRLAQASEGATLLYLAGARRVWLFGSLARGEVSDRCTDIDFAVEGLASDKRRSLRRPLRTLLRCKVDVVGLEHAGPALRRTIMESRVLLPRNIGQDASLPSRFPAPPASPLLAPRPVGLHQQRLQAVFDVIKASRLTSVVDFGCGTGLLLERLTADFSFDRILGVDSSSEVLAAARRRLGLGVESTRGLGRIALIHALATNPDPRFVGFDVAVAMELMEHLDPTLRSAFQKVIFLFVRPALFVATTPNAEYNVSLGISDGAKLRHSDHRLEWTRHQFQAWISFAAHRAHYACSFVGIGNSNSHAIPPTQMAICTRSILNQRSNYSSQHMKNSGQMQSIIRVPRFSTTGYVTQKSYPEVFGG
jgi:predicted nucleotidyltransferase/SAM-dependent methyltransferase